MRYIGGKSLLLTHIEQTVRHKTAHAQTFTDIFSGSGVVGEHFKKCGLHVCTNDFLYFSYVLARGTLVCNAHPAFARLGLADPLAYLNALDDNAPADGQNFDPAGGFVAQNYAPGECCQRMYFTPENARKIDRIRQCIEAWRTQERLSEDEYFYLLAALLNAVPYVSNITGVYGAYLKHWDKRALNPLTLEPPRIVPSPHTHTALHGDYTALLPRPCDILYADPPYNTREYLPNYHVLETIARYDAPVLRGVTGLRDYSGQKSAFCKKATVAAAFETLLREANARYILISYNNEGLLPTATLRDMCQDYAVGGTFCLQEFDYRRYKNKIPNNASGLKEQLYFLQRH